VIFGAGTEPPEAGSRVTVHSSGALQSVHNPGFDADDNRRRVWGRAEKAFGVVRVGGKIVFEGTMTFALGAPQPENP
jgi:hypothetical protein